MSRAQDEQAIALAGVFQAAKLVDQIAKRGLIPQNSFEASINSIFIMDPKATEDVYGGARDLPYNLDVGLKYMLEMAEKKSDRDKDIMRYALSLLHLENRLRKYPQMLGKISNGLDRIQNQADYFRQTAAGSGVQTDEPQVSEVTQELADIGSRYAHPTVIGAIADLYQETLSSFSFRIQVTGEPRHLQNNDNANKIRALLMAGVRAAILWRQVGGRRWQLLFFRARVGKSVQSILRGENT